MHVYLGLVTFDRRLIDLDNYDDGFINDYLPSFTCGIKMFISVTIYVFEIYCVSRWKDL